MAVNAATLQTYDSKTIREDLSNAENMISPTETPFLSTILGGGSKAENTKYEWPLVALAAVDQSNKVAEGEDAPGVDAANVASRRSNYSQIMDKLVKVSDTSQQVNGAAGVEKMAKQISYKLKELKRDKEYRLLANLPAVPGAADGATVRETAGFEAFIITNASRGATGTAPTLSGTTDGYPNAGHTAGTPRAITEDIVNTVIQAAWTAGGEPKYGICGPTTKRTISKTFNGYATKYKDADDKKLVNAVDIYESDFGQIQIVPDRFSNAASMMLIDPEFVSLREVQSTRQKELAVTGHSQNRLIVWEGGIEVGNEAAHAIITAIS
jgi:Family of unknown function (DUF5309)